MTLKHNSHSCIIYHVKLRIKTIRKIISISLWLNVVKIGRCPIMHQFLHFDYNTRLIPVDSLEVKWLNSHTYMSYVTARTLVKFNGSMDTNYLEGEEEKWVLHLFRRLVNLFYLLGS